MIYIGKKDGDRIALHLGEKIPEGKDFEWRSTVDYAQADGDEIFQACRILGRATPPATVFTFVGKDAQTIAVNWNNVRAAVRGRDGFLHHTQPGDFT